MPQISVVVPLYNKARYIHRCLGSILQQSIADFEVIVVNDGSTDGSEKVAAQQSDLRIRLVSQTNAGPGSARNHGVRLAQAPLVAFLDADDAWEPDYLKSAIAHLERWPEAASITCGMMIHPQRESTERTWRARGIPQGLFRAEPNTSAGILVAMLANMLPSSTVMRKQVFNELGGFYAKYRCVYSEDAHLYLKLLLRYPAVFDARPLTIRYQDASELAVNLNGVRPVEPFLIDPEDIERDCPQPMHFLCREVLTRRALKTASVYGYWGKRGESLRLVRTFARPGDWRLPYFATAIAGCTPLGGWAGALARKFQLLKDSWKKGFEPVS